VTVLGPIVESPPNILFVLIAGDFHHRQADHFGRGLEISEWISHPKRLQNRESQLKPFCSDKAVQTVLSDQSELVSV